MPELKTNVDKALMSQVAECFLKSVQENSCIDSGCIDAGRTGVVDTGGLHAEGLYPFSVADPIKLKGAGWIKDDYVKGNTCEDIYKLVDATVPVTDPEYEVYAADGQSLSGRWINVMRAGAWKSDHPSYPYWNAITLPDKIDTGTIAKIVVYDANNYMYDTFDELFPTVAGLPYITLASANTLLHVTGSHNIIGGMIFIFRLGLAESVTYGDALSLYPAVASAVNQIKLSNSTVIMCTPHNAPTHLIEVYKQISLDLDCLYLPSSVPMDANTNATLAADLKYIDIRTTYWLMNEILSNATAELLTMYSPDPSHLSTSEIVKHLDIELREQ